MKKNERKSFSLKDRIGYWFDNRMSRGSLGFIRILIVVSVLFAVLIAGLIILFGFNEEGETASVFWDSIATVINAWMPSFEDGSPGYVILMSLTAVAGVLFTSVLIGIITSAIEEKIDSLKRGNSLVLEKDHTVVLGFYPGEYALLQHLILAAAGKPACIVLAEDTDRQEMEEAISENLDVPKNFRIVCRTADITDPASLEKCSIETARTVIVSPTDDMRTLKAILAVSALLEEKDSAGVNVNAIISGNGQTFPRSLTYANNITTFATNTILAKLIAHSCTQTGLSEVFREVFNFEGCEFYFADIPGIGGMTFEELSARLDNATPTGIRRDGRITVNPPAATVLEDSDSVLVFADSADSAVLGPEVSMPDIVQTDESEGPENETGTVIIGYNETLPLVIRELPETVSEADLYCGEIGEDERLGLDRAADDRNLAINYRGDAAGSDDELEKIAESARHIVILNDHSSDADEADMKGVFLLLSLRDIRKRKGLDFNVTVEMQKEQNQKLTGRNDHIDYLVASSMSSLILAQLAESPELIEVFREILSNKGNELYLKSAGQMRLTGEFSVRDLRRIMLKKGYILMGDLDAEKHSTVNRRPDEKISLTAEDQLIVIGEK